MSEQERVERLFARWVERKVVDGTTLAPEDLCADDPELAEPLRAHIRRYRELEETLCSPDDDPSPTNGTVQDDLPSFAGFRTVERIGRGGAGEVYKLVDLALGRSVAAKVIRTANRIGAGIEDFIREARSLALFDDPRIVRILEFRGEGDPPVLLMEYVDGFALDRIAASLEIAQRARLMVEIAEAIHRAHELGVQHRDLKPANILVDAELRPRILDFGLSRGEPDTGHWAGTPAYMAPEQLDPSMPIDARTDVYALGVLFYELLCGSRPFDANTVDELVAAIRAGRPRLPMEIDPAVPEPLQAIALKAMERDPNDRFRSARDMALDLRRWLQGAPVAARPTLYEAAVARRSRPHLEDIREWVRLKLIYPHEGERLVSAYRSLEAREDDWIVEGRALTLSRITLYLGAFLLIGGSLLYFAAYTMEAVSGLVGPLTVLGLPFAGLAFVAARLYRTGRPGVAVAFYLASVGLLPLALLIVFREAGWWSVAEGTEGQLMPDGYISNRQWQVSMAVTCAWAWILGRLTRTAALSSFFVILLALVHLAILTDFGLRAWFEEGRWDLLALHLAPLVVVAAVLGRLTERARQPWFGRALYVFAAGLGVVVIELLSLDGKAMALVGLSTGPLRPDDVTNPTLLDTIAAMTAGGVVIYVVGALLERSGTHLMRSAAWLLLWISPFAVLKPLAWLNGTSEYSTRFLWFYLALALAITFLSRVRQRKSFYFAGLLNTGIAIWQVTARYEWFDRPSWAIAVAGAGLVALAAGFGLDRREDRRRYRS